MQWLKFGETDFLISRPLKSLKHEHFQNVHHKEQDGNEKSHTSLLYILKKGQFNIFFFTGHNTSHGLQLGIQINSEFFPSSKFESWQHLFPVI